MDTKQTFYAIFDTVTEKFVSKVTESTGKIYLVKNPFSSNYFTSRSLAMSWRLKYFKILYAIRYQVVEFQKKEVTHG